MNEVEEAEYEKMRQDLSNALARVQHLEAQLTACAMAAVGDGLEISKGAYGWSPSFQSVAILRKGYDALCRLKLK